MINKQKTIFSVFGFLLAVLSLTACAEKIPKQLANTLPVKVYSGLQLGALLNQAITSNNVADIKTMLNKDWYSAVNVKSLKLPGSTYAIKSCTEYFKLVDKALTTVRENESSAFAEFVLMCQAAKVIIEAKPSKHSFLDDLKFDKKLPNKLPKQIAMVISTTESKRLNENSKLVSWGDVNKINKVDVINNVKAIYHHQGSTQEIELMAKGDFNNDGIEDMLVSSRDSVVGGSYNALRVYQVTKLNHQAGLEVINEISD